MTCIYLQSATTTVEFCIKPDSVTICVYPTGKRWLGRKNTITVAQAREKYRQLVQAGFEKW